jgi:hypothetical protein
MGGVRSALSTQQGSCATPLIARAASAPWEGSTHVDAQAEFAVKLPGTDGALGALGAGRHLALSRRASKRKGSWVATVLMQSTEALAADRRGTVKPSCANCRSFRIDLS